MSSSLSSRVQIPAAALTALLLLGAVAPALAQDTIDDLRTQREENAQAAADAAAQLDTLTADDQDLLDAIGALDAQIVLQESKVTAAQRAIADAEASAARFRDQAALFQADLDDVTQRLAETAIDAYVRPSASAMSQLNNSNLMEGALRRSFLDDIVGDTVQLLDELRSTEARQLASARSADAAAREAEELRAEMSRRLANLDAARLEQQSLRAEVQERILEWEANVATIEQANLEIGDEIRRMEEEAARKAAEEEARRQAKEAARKKAAREAARAAAEAAASNSGSNSGNSDSTQPPSPIGDFVITHRPVPGFITSGYGPRTHPVFGSTRYHYGIDMNARTGDPILAAADGVVITARWINGYGNAVAISHGGGFTTLYAHQSELLVAVGDEVVGGEVIGLAGSTGWSTGPHLHLEVRINGDPVDPTPYLP